MGILITIKCHIREPKENNDWYQQLALTHPDKFQFAASSENLVALMASHQILASYHSTAIFEALGLGIPVITIGTPEYPQGTNTLVEVPIEHVLKGAPSSKSFTQLLERYQNDELFRQAWTSECKNQASYFYEPGYEDKLTALNEHLMRKERVVQ